MQQLKRNSSLNLTRFLSIALYATVILVPFASRADTPYHFIKVSCIKELHYFSVETFMLWNACGHGESCSKFSHMQEDGVYDLGSLIKNPKLPKSCDLGFGKKVQIYLSDFSSNLHGDVGNFIVEINEEKVDEFSTFTENQVQITQDSNLLKGLLPTIRIKSCAFLNMRDFKCFTQRINEDGSLDSRETNTYRLEDKNQNYSK